MHLAHDLLKAFWHVRYYPNGSHLIDFSAPNKKPIIYITDLIQEFGDLDEHAYFKVQGNITRDADTRLLMVRHASRYARRLVEYLTPFATSLSYPQRVRIHMREKNELQCRLLLNGLVTINRSSDGLAILTL